MKFIGQNIQDFISRFRNDVFLESISTGTIASGGNLGLDSNNKIVKATVGASNLTLDNFTAATITTSSESFADNDTTLMTSASINDRILSFGYGTGSVTTVRFTTDDSNIASANGDSADFTLVGGVGIDTSSVNAGDAITIRTSGSGTFTDLIIDGDRSVTEGADGAMLHVDASTITNSSTSASGTASQYNHVLIESPTLAATNASVTTTTASTLRVLRPQTGTNQTITNANAISTNGNISTAGLKNSANYSQTGGDITLYDATNDGNPSISLGSSDNERFKISAVYESGAQGLDVVQFESFTAGTSTNDARYSFKVDESFLLLIKDAGLQIKASGSLEIGNGNAILSDSSGTTTLSNIDALDATTESTIETAIDTLSNLTTVGTIGTGVWEGTAIATTSQKHLMHYEFKGFGTGDGSNFEMNVTLEDNQAPFEHATNIGSDGLTAITLQNQIRSGGQVMPRACTLKRWTGWSTCAGSASTKIRLLKLTPVRNNNSNRSMVLLHEFSYTALGNTKAESFDITSFTESSVSAGDILLTGILAASGKTMYFTSTLEVEF